MNKLKFSARSAAFLRRRAGEELVLISASKAQDYFLGIWDLAALQAVSTWASLIGRIELI